MTNDPNWAQTDGSDHTVAAVLCIAQIPSICHKTQSVWERCRIKSRAIDYGHLGVWFRPYAIHQHGQCDNFVNCAFGLLVSGSFWEERGDQCVKQMLR